MCIRDRFIGNIRDSVAQLSDTYTKQLNFLAENLPQLPDDEVSEPIIRYTSIKAIEKQLKVSKPQLESMSDVDDYLRELRQLLAVSYTHLDVYKRQIRTCVLLSGQHNCR